MALPPMVGALASKAIKHAPAIGAGVGAVAGGLKKDDQGNRGGIGGAVKGALGGAAAGYGAKSLAGKLTAPKTTPSARLAIENKPSAAKVPEVQSATGKKLAFVIGFEKTADYAVAKGIGSVKGYLSGAVKGVKKTVSKYVRGAGQAAAGAERSAAGRSAIGQKPGEAAIRAVKRNTGSNPSANEAQNILKSKQEEAYARLRNINRIKDSKPKPSFLRSHPIASTAIGIAGYKTLTSGGNNQQQQQPGPQVYQPSY